VAYRRGQVALADAGTTHRDDIDGVLDEGARAQALDL
jgi:hypothetical protein